MFRQCHHQYHLLPHVNHQHHFTTVIKIYSCIYLGFRIIVQLVGEESFKNFLNQWSGGCLCPDWFLLFVELLFRSPHRLPANIKNTLAKICFRVQKFILVQSLKSSNKNKLLVRFQNTTNNIREILEIMYYTTPKDE
jgi:hypothetical protein